MNAYLFYPDCSAITFAIKEELLGVQKIHHETRNKLLALEQGHADLQERVAALEARLNPRSTDSPILFDHKKKLVKFRSIWSR